MSHRDITPTSGRALHDQSGIYVVQPLLTREKDFVRLSFKISMHTLPIKHLILYDDAKCDDDCSSCNLSKRIYLLLSLNKVSMSEIFKKITGYSAIVLSCREIPPLTRSTSISVE